MEAVAGSRRRELLGLAVVVRRRDRLRLSPPTPASCRRLRSRPPADRQRVRFFGSRRSTGGTGDTCSPAIASAPRQGCWGGRLRRVVTFVWPGRRGNSFTMALLSLALPAAGCGCEPSTPSKSCEPRSSSLLLATTKPGSSPGTAIVHQPKCEPINAGLIRTLRPT